MISFIHSGGPTMASFRYRAAIPARELGWGVNQDADIRILSKPMSGERGQVVDFCDDHFDTLPHYRKLLDEAQLITCPTAHMQARIESLGRKATIIPDPYEYPQEAPHCNGTKLLWFGHQTNLSSLHRLLPLPYELRVVSNAKGAIPWSPETLKRELALADMVILPATKSYKSPNRAVEAIRQGCFVVAEPHPALDDFPIWKGDIKEGIEWAKMNLDKANEMTRQAQEFVSSRFAPLTVASVWKKAVGSVSTLGPVLSAGSAGLQ